MLNPPKSIPFLKSLELMDEQFKEQQTSNPHFAFIRKHRKEIDRYKYDLKLKDSPKYNLQAQQEYV